VEDSLKCSSYELQMLKSRKHRRKALHHNIFCSVFPKQERIAIKTHKYFSKERKLGAIEELHTNEGSINTRVAKIIVLQLPVLHIHVPVFCL